MLISQVSNETVLPPCLTNVDITACPNVKFLLVFTSAEAKCKAETLAPDVARMLRQKHAILSQINQLTLRMKENNTEKVIAFLSLLIIGQFSSLVMFCMLFPVI